MDYYKIGQFIADRRKKLNLTQKQLGEKLNVTDKAVSKWERGLGCPDVSILGELSEILEVGIGEILNGEYNDSLKDNSLFVKNAVDYSKKITEDNIYNKIRKILYCILIIIVSYISFMGIKQFIYMQEEIDPLLSDVLYNEYQEMKLKIDTIRTNEYFNKKDSKYLDVMFNAIINEFENGKLLSKQLKYYEIAEFSNIFAWFTLGFDHIGSYLIKTDNSNQQFYELLFINQPIYVYNDKMYVSISGEEFSDYTYYENMYMYDQMEEIEKANYYYAVLETEMRKFNKMLDFVIEVGDKNA